MRFISDLAIAPLSGEENYFNVSVTAELIPAAGAVGGGGSGGVPVIPPFGPALPDGADPEEFFSEPDNWPFPDDPVYPAFGRMGVYDPQVLGEPAIFAVDFVLDLAPLGDGKQYLYAACDASTGVVGANGKALRILDVTNPLAMLHVTALELTHDGANVRAHAVEKVGGTLIIKFQTDSSTGLGRIGLMTVDVTDPSAPAILASAVHRSNVTPINKIGSGLMLTDTVGEVFSNGVEAGDVFSVSDYTDPAFPAMSEVNVSGSNFQDRFARIGDLAYASAGAFLYMIDLTSAPTLTFTTEALNSITGAGATHGHMLTIGADLLYIIDAALGVLEIWDVSTPATPVFVGETQNAGLVGAHDLQISESSWLFGLTIDAGFCVDVRDAAAPAFLHSYVGFFQTTRLEGGWGRWLFASELRGQGRILAQQYFSINEDPLILDVRGMSDELFFSSFSSEFTVGRGVCFSPDGLEMYVLSSTPEEIHQYSLTLPHDPSTRSYQSSYDTSAFNETNGIFIHPEGLKIYAITRIGGDRIRQIALGTPFDLSTAGAETSYLTSDLGATTPLGVSFKADGTKIFIMASDRVYSATMDTPWDVTTLTAVGVTDYSFAGLVSNDKGFAVTNDGRSFIIQDFSGTGGKNKRLKVFTMSVPWDLITTSLAQVSNLPLTSTGNAVQMAFNADNTKVLAVTNTALMVQYNLNQLADGQFNFLWVTGPYTENLDTAANNGFGANTAATGFQFKPDGSQVFVVGSTLKGVATYDLSTAFDLSTATQAAFDNIMNAEVQPKALYITPNGLHVFYVEGIFNKMHCITLGTAWDMSTAGASVSYNNTTGGSSISSPTDIEVSADGSKLWVIGGLHIAQFTLGTPYTLDTAPTFDGELDLGVAPFNALSLNGLTVVGEQVIIATFNDTLLSLTMDAGGDDITTAVLTQDQYEWDTKLATPAVIQLTPTSLVSLEVSGGVNELVAYPINV